MPRRSRILSRSIDGDNGKKGMIMIETKEWAAPLLAVLIVACEAGAFEDTFEPFAVHIYKFDSKP